MSTNHSTTRTFTTAHARRILTSLDGMPVGGGLHRSAHALRALLSAVEDFDAVEPRPDILTSLEEEWARTRTELQFAKRTLGLTVKRGEALRRAAEQAAGVGVELAEYQIHGLDLRGLDGEVSALHGLAVTCVDLAEKALAVVDARLEIASDSAFH